MLTHFLCFAAGAVSGVVLMCLDEQLARYRSMEEDAHRLESDHTLTAELIERLIDRIEITHDHDIHVTFRFQSEFTEQRKAVPLCANT